MSEAKIVIKTSQFGELEVEEKHIFTFTEGVLGFETLKKYVLVSEEESAPFKWLISVEEPGIGFPLLSPWHIDITYNPGKQYDLDNQVLFVVVTLSDETGSMTANMKAPLIFDVKQLIGEQIILTSDKYSTNYLITKMKK